MHKPFNKSPGSTLCVSMLILAALLAVFPAGIKPLHADPAFLAPGTMPNVLIVMDNSESMLDMAYTPDSYICHDRLPNAGVEAETSESAGYQSATTYVGYFSPNEWYAYNPTRDRFERISKPAACSTADGLAYTAVKGDFRELCLGVYGDSIGFKARGNLLNWASASRFDIQKKVLTGGKYNRQDRTLVSEGRGCSGTRYIRQVPVWDTVGGSARVLPLGIRVLHPGQDQTTAMEVFSPHPTGFDNSHCQALFEAMPASDGYSGVLEDLVADCLEDGELPFEPPKAADPTQRMPDPAQRFNLPSLLTDRMAEQQLGHPLLVMRGVIHDARFGDEPPTGIIQQSAGKLRLGIMQLNHDGSPEECRLIDQALEGDVLLELARNDCTGDSRDGGRIIVDIQDGAPGHLDEMVVQVNAVNADAWSPLAEALFTAIGYYTQRPDMRLNPADFNLDAHPCTHWCQTNNILVITDGASTVDLHPGMTTFASVEGQNDGDRDSLNGCPGLFGSTFLDDIAAYGFSGSNIHLEDPFDAEKHYQNIKTFFVVAGNLGSRGAGECSPSVLLAEAAARGGSTAPYFADQPQDLEDQLKSALNMIRIGGYAGPTASVFSAGPNRGGAVYRSRFWPAVETTANPVGPRFTNPAEAQVTWIGDVNALLMDADGRLYEDTNANQALDALDETVSLYLDTDVDAPRACSQEPEVDGTCPGSAKTLDQLNHLWSAAEWLADIADVDVSHNREEYISETKKRYIFTWNDLDNNGAIAGNEILPFVPLEDWYSPQLSVAGGRAPVPVDFSVVTSQEVNRIISWIRGLDDPADPSSRSRQVPPPPNFTLDNHPETITWRLGDIIHSTPTVVANPSENYHLLYNDDEYAAFAAAHMHRRHVIYFGGNDGMVHAVNGGFYDAEKGKFWRGYDRESGRFSDTGPDLGAELWAYVPYNLLPHLKQLTRKGYRHTYFVDLSPRVFDVQIFDSSPDSLGHVNGWGTIMVVGMRLGGNRISAREIIDASPSISGEDERVFTSAYIVFDVTDPEHPPRLLGELTFQSPENVDIGYTTVMPVVAPIKTAEDGSDWFLIMGSGPTAATGVSDQDARICIFPLADLDIGQAFRIPSVPSYSHASAGSFNLTGSPLGFVSGITVADYDLDDLYQTDVVYFGTVEGDWGGWDGRIYRWVTNAGFPQNWSNPAIMFDVGRPVTSPPVVGFDGSFHWIYFGTGRFFDIRDKTDGSSNNRDIFFGIKEPLDATTGDFTWAPVQNKVSTAKPPPGNNAGSRTLLAVDRIEVSRALNPSLAPLGCRDDADCLPEGVAGFKDLHAYIVGSCDPVKGCTGADGWVHAFESPRERNLGQATLLGGLISFTTYQPFDDICRPAGQSFFYNLHFQTGTAYSVPVVDHGNDPVSVVDSQAPMRTVMTCLPIGKGLASSPLLVANQADGNRAYIQTTAGAFMGISQTNLPIPTIQSGRLNWRSDLKH